MTASPTKLRTGDWGAKVQSDAVQEGDEITITTRAGKSWRARVGKVVWRGDGVAIVATESLDYVPAARNSRGLVVDRGHYDEYCGYRCPVSGRTCCPANGPCHDCA